MAKRFEQHQIEALQSAFEESEHLTKEKKMELVAATGLDVEQIASWFSRKRARKRAKEVETELQLTHSRLQQELRVCRWTEADLHKELLESKKREANLNDENRRLKERLAIAEGDKQFGSLIRFFEDENRRFEERIAVAETDDHKQFGPSMRFVADDYPDW
ncbi:homeobox-leucine zipper protein ATHB-23-like [Sesamum indicum]|uniref:Homeobox-leucine zipper protein n=1 Tax=Sesamum indicum TaxID=4182 RepID=A0A6I9SPS7_SESIN|nr:homeobox-leucine zipper protein ATHB-23-like [Sesamum indicum]